MNRPGPWLGAVDGTAELDSTALGSFIDGLEHFALSLRGLRRRYDTVVRAVSRRLSARGTP